ncbi:hypothetical protein ACJMK2_036617 [Sinanodonta woodiana]|uniref:KASH domain-containing protein n=1 Tax=Sinanodonta woodiana TaxID=1069815 RepID=A0ABD3WHS4_SINWO
MSQFSHTMSGSRENLYRQSPVTTPERSPSREVTLNKGILQNKYGSTSCMNQEPHYPELPSEPKRRRIMADDSFSSVSSQVSSRSHSPSFSETMDESVSSTPGESPSATLREHFRRRYKKDELWAAIESNYQYLMDKEIIEACRTTGSDNEEYEVNTKVSFGEFLQQYQELSDWLNKVLQVMQKQALNQTLSEKYLNQSYYEEMMQHSPRHKLFNEYAKQLQQRHPHLKDDINSRLKHINGQWQALADVVAPYYQNQDPDAMLRDLDDDLKQLRSWLDDIEGQLLTLGNPEKWELDVLEGKLKNHKVLQQEIESHSRIVSAVLKLSERLQKDDDAFEREAQRDSVELSALNLERRWHTIWLKSLEWQCRLEDAINRRKGIFTGGQYIDFSQHIARLREDCTDDDDDYQNVTGSSADDSFHFNLRGDFIQSPPQFDSTTSLSPDSGNKSDHSCKDSAVVSENEHKSSDMSENYADLSVSTGSDSDREFLRHLRIRGESKDIGYGSESQSNDEVEMRQHGIAFSGISTGVRRQSRECGNSAAFYATVAIDTGSSERSEQSEPNVESQAHTTDESSKELVPELDESEREDIKFLIDHAEEMVKKGNTYGQQPQSSPKRLSPAATTHLALSTSTPSDDCRNVKSPKVQMVDAAVGTETVESSCDCDASAEDTSESDDGENFSTASEDAADTIFDSVIGEEYTSDEKYASRDNFLLPRFCDTSSLRRRLKGPAKDRPWSVIELNTVPSTLDAKPLSTSESAIDRLGSNLSDSDTPAKLSQSKSSTFPQRTKRARAIHRTLSAQESSSPRSQIGAKRKLDYKMTQEDLLSCVDHSGIITSVPLEHVGLSDDDDTPMPRSADGGSLMHELQSARFRSSGSSYSETEGPIAEDYETVQSDQLIQSEADDPMNDAGSFSETAWDNYQAPLYPTGSEEPTEEALPWEPQDMEFDDEFSLPQNTILAELIARRGETEKKTRPMLVPSSSANYEDSDSDIEDLHHVLEESRTQLKVADHSLRKKRKDSMGTGLYLNPGKYGELLATCDTNVRCLEAINQHLDSADVQEEDIKTIQDLLYQWEKLHALASERRNQSQELKTMYATLQASQQVLDEGVPQLNKTRFKDMVELQATVEQLRVKEKQLEEQQIMFKELRGAVENFAAHNSPVNMENFFRQTSNLQDRTHKMRLSCIEAVRNLHRTQLVWQEYRDTRKELEFLLTQERDLLQKLAYCQETDMNCDNAEKDLKTLLTNLELYEQKLLKLQKLRADLSEVSDDEAQVNLTAGIADIRNQIFVAQKQCFELMRTAKLAQRNVDENEEEMISKVLALDSKIQPCPPTMVTSAPDIQPKKETLIRTGCPAWVKSFPLHAIALAIFLGLVYLINPDWLDKLANFTLRISPELKYVNGPPPI